MTTRGTANADRGFPVRGSGGTHGAARRGWRRRGGAAPGTAWPAAPRRARPPAKRHRLPPPSAAPKPPPPPSLGSGRAGGNAPPRCDWAAPAGGEPRAGHAHPPPIHAGVGAGAGGGCACAVAAAMAGGGGKSFLAEAGYGEQELDANSALMELDKGG